MRSLVNRVVSVVHVDSQRVEGTHFVPSSAKLWSSVMVITANIRSTEGDSVNVLLHDLSDGVGHVLNGTVVLQPSASSVNVTVKVGLSDCSRSRHDKCSLVSSSVVIGDHVLISH